MIENRVQLAWRCWDHTHREINTEFAAEYPSGYVLVSFVANKFNDADYPETREVYGNWFLDMHPTMSEVDVGGSMVSVYLADQSWMEELQYDVINDLVDTDDPCPCSDYNFTPGVTPITECK